MVLAGEPVVVPVQLVRVRWVLPQVCLGGGLGLEVLAVLVVLGEGRGGPQGQLTDPDRQPHTGRYGEDGAKLHHDLVNARNFALTAFTTVLGDARDFHTICLGTNLTEASVYPDNNQQFMRLLRALMAYAAKPYHRITISQPVGTLMRQEIIRLGLELGVPYEDTYRCYFGRDRHCGRCGSCYNRHLAFAMNNVTDPTDYEVVPTAGPVAVS